MHNGLSRLIVMVEPAERSGDEREACGQISPRQSESRSAKGAQDYVGLGTYLRLCGSRQHRARSEQLQEDTSKRVPPFVWGLHCASLFSVDTNFSTAYDAARFYVHWAKHQAMTEPTLTEAHYRAVGAMGTWTVCIVVPCSTSCEVLNRSAR